jgi:hypothetical protein
VKNRGFTKGFERPAPGVSPENRLNQRVQGNPDAAPADGWHEVINFGRGERIPPTDPNLSRGIRRDYLIDRIFSILKNGVEKTVSKVVSREYFSRM